VKLDARPVSLDALLDVALHASPVRLSAAAAWRRLLGEIGLLSPILREDRRVDMDITRLTAWIGRRPARK